MEKLKFLETVTVNEFKAQKGVNKIEVKQNPHTGKCFFVYGCETGAVSDKFINGEVTNPVISQVCSPDTGDMFYMLHQRGEGGAMTLATLNLIFRILLIAGLYFFSIRSNPKSFG